MTRHPWTRLFALCCVIGTLGVALLAHVTAAQAQSYPYQHDNSTALHNWTHGDPNIGTGPRMYYYLKAIAAGNNAFCEIYSGGDWNLRLEDSDKHILAQANFTGTGGRVYITNAVAGHMYQCRIENLSSVPQKDYAELNSGATGDTVTSDCGGPGPVWDPNFDLPPMEPAHTIGMPTNGCDGAPGSLPYDATDPRVGIPAQDSYDLGVNVGAHTYTLTTTRTADLTAFVMFGHQGTWGNLAITDAAGNVVNGVKWGAQEPNPGHRNQEYVGADAGVQPPGTYHVVFSGPANTQHVWAISGNA